MESGDSKTSDTVEDRDKGTGAEHRTRGAPRSGRAT